MLFLVLATVWVLYLLTGGTASAARMRTEEQEEFNREFLSSAPRPLGRSRQILDNPQKAPSGGSTFSSPKARHS